MWPFLIGHFIFGLFYFEIFIELICYFQYFILGPVWDFGPSLGPNWAEDELKKTVVFLCSHCINGVKFCVLDIV